MCIAVGQGVPKNSGGEIVLEEMMQGLGPKQTYHARAMCEAASRRTCFRAFSSPLVCPKAAHRRGLSTTCNNLVLLLLVVVSFFCLIRSRAALLFFVVVKYAV